MQVESTTDDETDADIEIKLEPGIVATRLTETVRKYYRSYLEKQLKENVSVCCKGMAATKEDSVVQEIQPVAESTIQACAGMLEEKALRTCMMAQLYQRKMVKIIATVHRYTQKCRLERNLQNLNLKASDSIQTHFSLTKTATTSKSTQTEPSVLKSYKTAAQPHQHKTLRPNLSPAPPPLPSLPVEATQDDTDSISLSLQAKIEMFQARLNKEKAAQVAAYRKHAVPTHNFAHDHLRHTERQKRRRLHTAAAPASFTTEMPSTSASSSSSRYSYQRPHLPAYKQAFIKPTQTSTPHSAPTSAITNTDSTKIFPHTVLTPAAPLPLASTPKADEDDLVAQELEQLFSEERTEIDEIFGINTSEPDDPQICSILREIENAKMPQERLKASPPPLELPLPAAVINERVTYQSDISPAVQSYKTISVSPAAARSESSAKVIVEVRPSMALTATEDAANTELHRSVWPCELFMQRRRLSASLSRLIEEDFRWHELIKWKFTTLFGEDSDDEFSAISPSIELDEVLISSCIRRISPWIVNYLMPPMRDGLIANRFLFKKLAKRLGRSIVMENQYPDERTIKLAVEKYFCLHHAVMSTADLTDIPNISFNDDED